MTSTHHRRATAPLPPEQADFAAQTFAALGDRTRSRIVYALTQGEQSVNALAEMAGVSASAVSHHLAHLRDIRLVKTRRAGNQVFYSVDDAHIANLFREALYHLDHVKRNLPDHDRD